MCVTVRAAHIHDMAWHNFQASNFKHLFHPQQKQEVDLLLSCCVYSA